MINKGMLLLCSILLACSPHERTNVITSDTDRQSYQAWQQARTKQHPQHAVVWLVTITELSGFGGFHAKGHLIGHSDARIHLITPPDTSVISHYRQQLSEQTTMLVRGTIEGVTTENEVIVLINSVEKPHAK